MEENQSFENSDMNKELLGLSTKRKKNIIIYGSIISALLISCIILSVFFLSQKKNSNLKDTQIIKFYQDSSNDTVQRFFNVIPSFIKGDANGDCELNRGGLTLNEGAPIVFTREYSSIVENVKSYQMTKVSGKFDTSLSPYLTVLYNEFNFKLHVENLKEGVYDTNSEFLTAKYNLGSLSIKNEDVSINPQLKRKLVNIADNFALSDAEKTEELNKLFQSYGYYIPLTINIGGQFVIDTKEIESSTSEQFLLELMAKINIAQQKIGTNNSVNYNEIMKKMYNFRKVSIIGGDIKKSDFNEWIASLTLENCDITGYSNIIPITDLLDNEIKSKMLKPLKQIEDKYNKRRRYIKIIEDLRKRMSSLWKKEKVKGNDGDGMVKEESDLVYLKTFRVEKKWSALCVETDFREPFTDIIVGWKITDLKEHNGEWTLKENPLLKYKMDAHFKSELSRGIDYEISIYFMRYPE